MSAESEVDYLAKQTGQPHGERGRVPSPASTSDSDR